MRTRLSLFSMLTVLSSLIGLLGGVVPAAAASGEPDVIRFHGGGYDQAADMAVDPAGNIYLAGAIERPSSTNPMGLVTKLSPSGAVQWIAHYSGSQGGVGGLPTAVTLDGAGNVYVAAIIGDGVMFNTNWDFLVVKFSPAGVEQWARRYDGPARGYDRAGEIAVDSAGGVYVSGFSYGQNYDWTTLKYSASGVLLWERRHAGPGTADDRVADMALAPSGNLVVTGSIQPSGDGRTNDVETLVYDPAGNVVWQRRWTDTPTSHEMPADLDIDGVGRIAITGITQAAPGPYATPFPATVRYDAAGNLLQTLRTASAGGAAAHHDANGNLYLVGSFFATEGASSVAKYSASGALVWSTPITVAPDDAFGAVAIAVDSAGTVTVAGTVTAIFVSDSDYMAIRYGADGSEQWRYRFAGPAQGRDYVADLVVETDGDALVAGTSWNDYLSIGGTADDIVTLRFASGTAPALVAPTDLTAASLSRSEIRLRWQDHSGTEDGFRIERCTGTGCTNFVLVATVGHDVTTYVDTGLASLTTYRYRVQAVNGGDGSAYSNVATAKTKRR